MVYSVNRRYLTRLASQWHDLCLVVALATDHLTPSNTVMCCSSILLQLSTLVAPDPPSSPASSACFALSTVTAVQVTAGYKCAHLFTYIY